MPRMPSPQDARVLVTGGAGFIGGHLAEALVGSGARVRVVDNLATGHAANLAAIRERIEFLEGDLRDPRVCAAATAGADVVFHLAALPSVPRSVADPAGAHENNAGATLNVLLAARDAGVRRVVYAGSSSAYGDQAAESKTESLCPDPLSPYAVAKLAGEHYARAFARCYGLGTITLRYFNVFGPRQDPDSPYAGVLPRFVRALLRGDRPVIYGTGEQARDFTYVDNVVAANLRAGFQAARAEGQVYNIGCGAAHDVRTLLDTLQDVLGTAVSPEFAPARVGDVQRSQADISRAAAELGYTAETPFAEGVRRTALWYRDHFARRA